MYKVRCACGARAVRVRCACGARAVRVRCACGARAVRVRCCLDYREATSSSDPDTCLSDESRSFCLDRTASSRGAGFHLYFSHL